MTTMGRIMIMQDMWQTMNELCRKKFDFINDSIDQIETTMDYVGVLKMIEDFTNTCDTPEIYKIFLECKIWNLEKV